MSVRVSYLRGQVEGEVAFLGEAKIMFPGADLVKVLATQRTWDILESNLFGTSVTKLALDTVAQNNVASDGSKILLKNEDGSTAVVEYVFENPLSFQAFHLLVTNANSIKIEGTRVVKSRDKQKEWSWSGNLK